MKSSRLLIIDYLRAHRAITATELSRVLHITSADARHHLSQLSQQGIIISLGSRPTRQRGRPAKLYTLSASMARNNLGLLTHNLLTMLASNTIYDDYLQHLKNLALQFASNATLGASNDTRKIYEAIKYLKENNYDASWEAHFSSPRVILGHCPFVAIIDQHPEMCTFDAYLLETLLGKPVQQIEKLSTTARDLPYCVFIPQDMNR
jgi:predicted ArsR family transcriptional regulator